MKIEIGSPIKYDGEMYFIEQVTKVRDVSGSSITVFAVDEGIRSKKQMQRIAEEQHQENVRKVGPLMDKQDKMTDKALEELDEGV